MRRRTVVLLLLVWASVGVIAGATLMQSHWVPLTVPLADASAPSVAGGDGWTAFHVLQAECGCSRRVLAHLHERPPELGVRERILWITDGRDSAGTFPSGYEVELLSGAELVRKYHVAAAPVLVVRDPAGAARYCGGYTARKRGPDIRDREIIRATHRGTPPEPLPVFGCAVAARLKDATPLFLPVMPAEVP